MAIKKLYAGCRVRCNKDGVEGAVIKARTNKESGVIFYEITTPGGRRCVNEAELTALDGPIKTGRKRTSMKGQPTLFPLEDYGQNEGKFEGGSR